VSHQSQGDSLALEHGCIAWRAVEAAPAAPEVRDTLALGVSLARLFAILEVLELSRRVLHVVLSFVRVADDIGAEVDPGLFLYVG